MVQVDEHLVMMYVCGTLTKLVDGFNKASTSRYPGVEHVCY